MATLTRLKRGDENELERKLRLEKVVASEHLRLAMETEEKKEEQDWRMTGKDQTAQFGHGDGQKKKSKTGAQVGPGDRGRKKSKNGLDWIWI